MTRTAWKRVATALALAWLAGGCATEADSYSEKLEQIPTPTTDALRQQTCAWLRAEMDRQQRTATMANDASMPDVYASVTRAGARSRLQMLQTRWDAYKCDTVSIAGVTASGAPWNVPAAAPSVTTVSKPAAVASPQPASANPETSYMNAPAPIERCIAACKANTSKTPEQCFDSCNEFTSCMSACRANTTRSSEQCFDACKR